MIDTLIPHIGGLHLSKKQRVLDAIQENYSGDNQRKDIDLTTQGVNGAFKELLLRADELSGRFFSNFFTIDGLPVASSDDINETLQSCDLNGNLSQFVSEATMPQGDVPEKEVSLLYTHFLKMQNDGTVRFFPKDTVSLRGEQYYSAKPETRRLVKESGSVMPSINTDLTLLDDALSAMTAINQDSEDAKPHQKNTLASPLDHVKNVGLLYLNCAQLLSHGVKNPEVLSSGIDLGSRHGDVKELYRDIVDGWLSDSPEIKKITNLLANSDNMRQAITNIVGSYHFFLIDGDKSRLIPEDADIGQIRDLIAHIASSVQDFEQRVSSNTQLDKKGKDRVKRELFKRIFRHERDADHPGVNLLHVAQFIESEPSLDRRIVLGTTYGGIEYPFIYDALCSEIGANDGPSTVAYGSIIISNYNLKYRPSTSGLAKKHIFPNRLLDKADNATRVLVFDDNAVSGNTRLQILEFLRPAFPNATIEVACSDINTLADDIERHDALRAGLLALSTSGVRRFLKLKSKPEGRPNVLNPSRYAMQHKPKRPIKR